MVVEGGCCCGAIRYRVEGSPRRVTHCHCVHCRRTSGAPFVTWAEYDAGRFAILQGEPGRYEARPTAPRQFCRDCGTQLTFRDETEPEWVDITAASLDDPNGVAPEDHVWCDRKLAWIQPGDKLPQYGLSRAGEK